MPTEYDFHKRTKQFLQETIGTPFPREENKTSASEKPRSAQFARLVQAELASFDQYGVERVHQYHIVPTGKINEQDVDIACVVHIDKGSKVAATIEHKPTMKFPGFRTQAAMFGTDTTNHDELWYDPILPKMLARIACHLDALHKRGIAHDDIRIRDMVLHAGVLIDFDLSRKQVSLYPSTLQDIHAKTSSCQSDHSSTGEV